MEGKGQHAPEPPEPADVAWLRADPRHWDFIPDLEMCLSSTAGPPHSCSETAPPRLLRAPRLWLRDSPSQGAQEGEAATQPTLGIKPLLKREADYIIIIMTVVWFTLVKEGNKIRHSISL